MQLSFFKRCPKCDKTKLITSFNRRKSAVDGRDFWCRECNDESRNKWTEANRERTRENARAYRDANPERKKQMDKEWRESEQGKQKRKESRDKHSADNVARAYRWKDRRPDRYAEHQWKGKRVRRARLAGADGAFSKEEFDSLCASYDYICLCCRERKPLEADHVIPLSRGGSNTIDNIQPLCRSCNAHKHGKVIDYR